MSRKHELLATINRELSGIATTGTAEIGGHKYGLVVLNRAEESYAKTLFTDDTNFVQYFSDTSLPTLSVALRSIDSVTVEELFGDVPDDTAETERPKTDDDKTRLVRTNVRNWLASKPGPFVNQLWLTYIELKGKVHEALGELGPLSKKTSISEPKPTSSPEKELSSTTQASSQ